jgi:hypothetical protein
MKYRLRFDDVIGEDAEEDVYYNSTESIKDVLDDIEHEVNNILGIVEENKYTYDELIDMLKELSAQLY